MRIIKLDHSALIVSDLDRARWFYGDVLGLAEIPRPASFTFGGCWYRGDGFELHLILESDTQAQAGFGDAGEGARQGMAHHLGFEVDDIAATEAYLSERGVTIAGGPLARGDGPIQLYVLDPDGNFLEFFQRDGGSSLPVEERAPVRRPA
ncbi:MAG: VOC family protein [Anaerolineae bacterium]|nr:VOC family protein [Anaerolineae bacterium]